MLCFSFLVGYFLLYMFSLTSLAGTQLLPNPQSLCCGSLCITLSSLCGIFRNSQGMLSSQRNPQDTLYSQPDMFYDLECQVMPMLGMTHEEIVSAGTELGLPASLTNVILLPECQGRTVHGYSEKITVSW